VKYLRRKTIQWLFDTSSLVLIRYSYAHSGLENMLHYRPMSETVTTSKQEAY